MTQQTLDARIILKNDTAATWTSKNGVLLKGEMGVESDTGLFKFGDGTSAWSTLPYSGVIIAQSSNNGKISVNGSDITVYTLPIAGSSAIGGVKSGGNITVNSSTGAVTVNSAAHLGKDLVLSGDATGTASLSSSPAATGWALPVTLADSGVTAGTYSKVTVDSKGRVTAGAQLEATDLDVPIATSTATGVIKGGGDISVDSSTGAVTVNQAAKLKTSQTISLSGDATGSASFDGSAGATINATLANSGVTSGTYTKVTVDAKGRVTTGANLAASDITGLLGTAATKNTGTASGNVPILDSNGKLSTSVIPSVALMDVYTTDSQANMYKNVESVAQVGDICIRTDINKTYIKTANASVEPGSIANWTELLTPTDAVSSVNSKTGAVTLTTSDISEGTNLYWTASRFNTAFAGKASTGLSDSASLLRNTDTFIINCGGAV